MKNIYLHDMEVGILFVHNRTVLKYANVTKELIKHTWTCAEIIKGVATDSCSNSEGDGIFSIISGELSYKRGTSLFRRELLFFNKNNWVRYFMIYGFSCYLLSMKVGVGLTDFFITFLITRGGEGVVK